MIKQAIDNSEDIIQIAQKIKTGDVLATIFSIVFLVAFLWGFFQIISVLKDYRKKEEKNQNILQNIVNTNERSLDIIKKQEEIIHKFGYDISEIKNDNKEIKHNVHDLNHEFGKIYDGFINLKNAIEILKNHCGIVLDIKEEINENKKRYK